MSVLIFFFSFRRNSR